MKYSLSRRAILSIFASLAILSPLHAASSTKVFELFTSQGCSSCPPADRIAASLADNPDILVLSYHVDYWNYLGWKDPYSSEASTQRQRDYAAAWNTRRIYTPQAIIQGKHDIVGSNRRAIQTQLNNDTSQDWLTLSVKKSNGTLYYTLPESSVKEAEIWLVTFDKNTKNAVPRGENSGKTLLHRNSVTHIQTLGKWNGSERSTTIELPNRSDGIAILIQQPNHGAMLGAGWI